jgi:glycerophosphoryl diester phosphodiesterase
MKATGLVYLTVVFVVSLLTACGGGSNSSPENISNAPVPFLVSAPVFASALIPQVGWTLKSVDSEETSSLDGAATNAFDGDVSTFWHTQLQGSSPRPPHRIDIIGFRQPYIGVLSGHGDVYETLGTPESTLQVHLTHFASNRPAPQVRPKRTPLLRVAHAGGGFDGSTYLNTIEALEHNANAYELFEVDFSWTSDNELVCLHDWQNSFTRVAGIQTQKPLSLVEFESAMSSRSEFEPCTLQSLIEWLDHHEHARVVTDVKANTVRALALIASRYPQHIDRFVAQINQPSEYAPTVKLGYQDIIWALYRFTGSEHDVKRRATTMNLYAIAMPRKMAKGGLAQRLKDSLGIPSYVHTVNTRNDLDTCLALGADEIYTDWLPPHQYYASLKSEHVRSPNERPH